MFLTACSPATRPPSAGAITSTSTSTVEPEPLTPDEEALIASVEDAIDSLLGSQAVEITMVFSTPEESTATAFVDNWAMALESHQETIASGGGGVITDRIVLNDTMYVRIFQASEVEPDWTVLDIDREFQEELVGEAYTAFGTLGASLERIIELARNVSVSIEDRGTQMDGDLEANVVQFIFEAEHIRLYFAANQLELVGPFEAHGQTVYEFWIEDHVRRLGGAGTQFHDGEAIEDVLTRVDYSVATEGSVQPPG